MSPGGDIRQKSSHPPITCQGDKLPAWSRLLRWRCLSATSSPPATASLGHKTGLEKEEGEGGRSQCHFRVDAHHPSIVVTFRNIARTQTTSW